MKTIIAFKKNHPNARLPAQGKLGDAGFDLSCIEDFVIYPGQTKLVDTGLELADMSETDEAGNSMFLHVVGRSGLAIKGITTFAGVVDANYRGKMMVVLYNSKQPQFKQHNTKEWYVDQETNAYHFKTGDKIAQMIIQKIITNDSKNEVTITQTEQKTETVRNSDGFGSTGQ